jgi:ribA/ribD-fused uncharacterized protein
MLYLMRGTLLFGMFIRFGSLCCVPMPADLAGFDIQKTGGYADYGAASSWQAIQQPHKKILFYDKSKPYYEFTNFYPAPITVDGLPWPTSEHYYQAMKFTDKNVQDAIRQSETPRGAFNEAQKNQDKVRADWHTVNLGIMKRGVWEKFTQHFRLQMQLISTGAIVLIEDAGAKDSFFGAGAEYTGHNYLGRILMLIRTHMQKALLGFAAQNIVVKQQASMAPVPQQKRTWLQWFSDLFSSWFSVRAARG